jgi:hypothetical protein|tara:strand:- start:34 stop:258 length:225 start_codon:yes stop_codon:yes gene_type:complete
MDKVFLLVISMWGNTGTEWEYIGNQIVLQEPMTEKQCLYIIQDDKWVATYENEYYMMKTQCYPKECAGKEKCNG